MDKSSASKTTILPWKLPFPGSVGRANEKTSKVRKGVNPIFNGTAVSQSKKNKNRFVFDCECECECVYACVSVCVCVCVCECVWVCVSVCLVEQWK